VDAPLGHTLVNGKAKAMLAGPNGDNPLILGPAGTIHMSVLDFAKWVAWNAGEGKRGPNLVSAEVFEKDSHALCFDRRAGGGGSRYAEDRRLWARLGGGPGELGGGAVHYSYWIKHYESRDGLCSGQGGFLALS